VHKEIISLQISNFKFFFPTTFDPDPLKETICDENKMHKKTL